ncbi:MAG: tetratricopeptide repeat protein [Acidobacteriota bacterium]
MTGRRLALIACPLLAILTHLPATRCGFVFDDRAVIEANPLMRDLRDLPRLLASPYWNAPGLRGGLYRPLTGASFAVDRALAGGLRPGWFHLVNVLLHGLAVLLVTRLALDLLPGRLGPLVTGALFAVHPLNVEAVAGVVGRAELLAACGVLGAVLCHRRALRAPGPGRRAWAAAAWGAALAGMCSKESAVVAPVLCLLVDLTSPVAGASAVRRRILYVGHATALLAYLSARYAVLGSLGIGASIPFVDNPAASAGPLAGRLTALGVVARYAGLMLWPAELSADYSYDQIAVIDSPADPYALGGLLVVVAVGAGGAALLRRAPTCSLALWWIAVSSSLTTNLVIFIGTLLAERLMYLPSVGLCLLAGWALASIPGRLLGIATAVAAVAVGAASWRTRARIPDWKDDLALYGSAARVSPRSARIRFNLGNAHLRRSEYDRAEEEYRAALSIYPDFNDARINLGMAVLQRGRPLEALGFLKTAVSRSPTLPDAWINLGAAYRSLGDPLSAEEAFREALEIDRRACRAWNNLGAIALARGEIAVAIDHLRRAVDCDPGLAVLRINLADALAAAGRPAEADRQFETAYRLDPDLPEARRGRGEVALRKGDRAMAEREFRAAASGRPPSARAANFLGYLLAQKGDVAGAVRAYERAIRIDPTLHDAHRSLGILYADRLGDPERGARHLERSLEIAPDQPGAEEVRRRLRELRE